MHPSQSVDHWLAAVLRSPDMSFLDDYLLGSGGKADKVTCTVKRFYIKGMDVCTPVKDPDTFILYISASVSPESGVPTLSCSSPRAILACYTGFKDNPSAPGWTQWDHSTVTFWQPRGSFADLFARMAAWEVNLAVKGLSYRMVEWAKAISVRTWLDPDALGPRTPPKHRLLINAHPNPHKPFKVQDRLADESPCERIKLRGSRKLKGA